MSDKQQGGLTGATGSLTPSDQDDEFVPAETREINDPNAARRITAETHRRAEDRGAGVTSEAPSDGGDAFRGGYGSGSGLSAEDPAYRMDEPAVPPHERPTGGDPVLGGDTRGEPEDQHL